MDVSEHQGSSYRQDKGWPKITGEHMFVRHRRRNYRYFPNDDLIAAANVALACEIPLLLTGEPGCGKTDFAFAVAHELKVRAADDRSRELLECYVRSDSRAKELLYHHDAVRRFGDAQFGDDAAKRRAQDAREYVTLKPLSVGLLSDYQRVVLIDEIDKAPRDLPNDLLWVIERRRFDIPEVPEESDAGEPSPERRSPAPPIRTVMQAGEHVEPVVIVITSNVERQLPEPFLRRCAFYHIEFPETKRLMKILRDRFGNKIDEMARARIVKVFEDLRKVPGLNKRPATSELIDWTHGMVEVFEPAVVKRKLESFLSEQERSGGGAMSLLPWKTLPGLPCLLKLREDLAVVGAAASFVGE